MSEVDRLFAEYKTAGASGGEVDPSVFLARVEGGDRAELTALIDAHLARAPRAAWDPAAYAESAAAPLVESLTKSLRGQSGLWPSVLPRLRARARVKRGDLVAELADRLGAGREREKVAGYYHQMEQGLLPAAGVADEVLDALAGIVGSTRAALREAGESLAPGAGGGGAAEVFARGAPGSGDRAEPTPATSEGSEGEAFDEVDRLFRGR